MERLKRRLQRLHDVEAPSDLRGLPVFERPVGDSSDPRCQRAFLPEAFHGAVLGGEERLLADVTQSADKQPGEVAARVNGFLRCVRCPGAVGAPADASPASPAKYIGTGPSRISKPFPAESGSEDPA